LGDKNKKLADLVKKFGHHKKKGKRGSEKLNIREEVIERNSGETILSLIKKKEWVGTSIGKQTVQQMSPSLGGGGGFLSEGGGIET